MPAMLSLARAEVTVPDGDQRAVHKAVQLVVRNGVASMRKGRDLVQQREGVVTVARTARRQWAITFDDGSQWEALRKGGG